MKAFEDTALVREKGLYFNGATYNCVRADDRSIYGKKVRMFILNQSCYQTRQVLMPGLFPCQSQHNLLQKMSRSANNLILKLEYNYNYVWQM